ncbi:hypothetical protein BZG36_02336 [Bifiguratus adelaidae]|uniref:Uncharacterized protein n=1 Tax=Bifiguratus adelaidae TaxID=1938954 RepID=A0A261Y2J8_9FUNG|nr:hypothetical protein BZG36_02336 [Bifiguratus adelaidae]
MPHGGKGTRKANKRTPSEDQTVEKVNAHAVATIRGWHDGEFRTESLTRLDRWKLQASDSITVHAGHVDVELGQDPHSDLLGGYVWLSSIVFCSYLAQIASRPSKSDLIKVENGSVWLELGAGVGLIGLLLAKLGVGQVVITDVRELVQTMQQNVEANGFSNEEGSAILARELFWGNQDQINRLKEQYETFDYIVACDCIYSEASASALAQTMWMLASTKTTIIVLTELRNKGAQDAFIKEAEPLLYIETIQPSRWQSKIDQDIEFEEDLVIYKCTRRESSKERSRKRS